MGHIKTKDTDNEVQKIYRQQGSKNTLQWFILWQQQRSSDVTQTFTKTKCQKLYQKKQVSPKESAPNTGNWKRQKVNSLLVFLVVSMFPAWFFDICRNYIFSLDGNQHIILVRSLHPVHKESEYWEVSFLSVHRFQLQCGNHPMETD